MGAFDRILQRIAVYRACLERDAQRGIIPSAAAAAADECFAAIGGVLESARIELEGAGVPAGADAFAEHLVGSCSELARCLFGHMYREPDAGALAHLAAGLGAEARALFEHLWLRLESAA